ncbi:MAG TPA: RNA polymerase sigma factor RpoD, partial [Glaciecola sp.]|nr:RNA polymerase sigma factor RpoD [Glaciecola sp.]
MQSKQSQIKLLIAKGKEQGYLTFAEVNDHLPQDIVDSDQIEDIISMINDMGIQVFESAPDADELLMAESTTDEEVAEAAAQALATVESEIGRTTDPVRMYMREMGTVELLTREGEIEIAKRIEDGINQVQCSVAEYPEAITYLLDQWDLYEAEEIRLSDIIIGFVDPNEEANLAPTATHIGSDLSKEELAEEDDDSEGDEEEEDTGPDPELAREKFDALRKQYAKTRDAIEAKGRSNATAKRQIAALSDVFKEFRLIPKQFDRMVKNMRGMMDRVRIQERLIMKHCVAQAKMPKKDFIKAFAGNETSTDWYFKILKSNKPYVLVLETFQEDIERSVSKMNAVEAETGL